MILAVTRRIEVVLESTTTAGLELRPRLRIRVRIRVLKKP